MIKQLTILTILVSSINGRSEIVLQGDTNSPNGEFTVSGTKQVVITSANGSSTIIPDVENIQANVSINWNNSSEKLIAIEQYGKSADIYLASLYDDKWNTELIDDSTILIDEYKKAGIEDKVIKETKEFIGWKNENAIIMTLVTTENKTYQIRYAISQADGKTICQLVSPITEQP